MVLMLVKLLVVPGFLFLSSYGMIFEFLDRKIYARLQNRIGPPWYQPLADFLKLVGKETIIPAGANRGMFQTVPLISITAVATAFIYVPVFGTASSWSFEGDLIIVLYLLTLPTLAAFLAGWYSRGVYATIGSIRTLTQFFAYEVPLFMALLAPALIAGTWSISGIMLFYSEHPLYILINIPVLFIALVSGQGKLERSPFDAPEAETEVVSGALVEYSGKLFAILRLSVDCELVVIASLLSAIFMPFMTNIPMIDIVLYFIKTIAVLMFLAIMRAVMARLRMDQMVRFCWKYLTPTAVLQIILNLVIRSVLKI
jgi:NADH-quinone oxidoreductase subunit H